MATGAKQQDIIRRVEPGCWKGNWWCSGNLKTIKCPIKPPYPVEYLVGKCDSINWPLLVFNYYLPCKHVQHFYSIKSDTVYGSELWNMSLVCKCTQVVCVHFGHVCHSNQKQQEKHSATFQWLAMGVSQLKAKTFIHESCCGWQVLVRARHWSWACCPGIVPIIKWREKRKNEKKKGIMQLDVSWLKNVK